MAKLDACPFHCPAYTLSWFVPLFVWFILGDLGVVPVVGQFWTWVWLLSGICWSDCALHPAHQNTTCPFAQTPAWTPFAVTIACAWFLLADARVVSTFGLQFTHVLVAIIGLGILVKNQWAGGHMHGHEHGCCAVDETVARTARDEVHAHGDHVMH